MDRLPAFLNLQNRDCLVVGGGIVAERKTDLLRRTGARVTVLSPIVTDKLQRMRDAGVLTHIQDVYHRKLAADYWLVVAATEQQSVNHQIAADAEEDRRFCNVVDDNAASSFILPAIVDRSPVIIAIGTEGNAPVLAQQLKNQIEAWIPERIGELAAQAGRWREIVKKRFSSMRERRRFWQNFFSGPIADHLLAGRQKRAERAMRSELIGDSSPVDGSKGEAWIVGAGPGDPGLVTLRAQQLIGRADVILYDRLVSKPVLDFARKEAELISVGKRAGAQAMTQDEINSLLVQQVQAGRRVCRLKGGDPFVFGRGGEEALALAQARLPFQIVPGISAAFGCAAYAGIPLTLRGVAGSVTLATAKLDNASGPDWPRILNSGDTLALYMGSSSVNEIRTQLLANNVSQSLPVGFVENGTTSKQRTYLCDVATMAEVADAENIQSPALIYIGQAVKAAHDLQWFEGGSRAAEFAQMIDVETVTAASN